MDATKIFGIGLNKTGTTSLKIALERLGCRHLPRRPRLFKLYRQGRFEEIFEAIAGYESFEDWPWPLMVRQLLDQYGDDARFVLTRRRDSRAWVESLKRHSERTNPHSNPRSAIYGYAFPHGHEAEHMAFYDQHLSRVRALFADRPWQLLEVCWEEGDGWPQLCEFLQKPVPNRDFPVANRSAGAQPNPDFYAENKRLIAAQLARLTDG